MASNGRAHHAGAKSRGTRAGGQPLARVTSAMRSLGQATTRRAAVVAIVVCALAFTLAVPLRTYLAQQAEVSQAEERQERLETEVAQLEDRKAELEDPVQVEAEARARLRYVMPGETPYIVQLPDEAAEEGQDDGENDSDADAWYQRLWSNIAG